jgi:hypothetical protein
MLEAHPADAPEKHRTRAVQTVSPPKPHPTRSPRPSSHHRAPSHLDPSRTKLDAPRKSPPNRHPLYPPSAPRDDRTIHWSPRSPRATRQRRARREPRRVPRRPNKLLIPLYPSPTGLTPSASRPAPRGQGAREDGAERPSGREHRPQQATPAPRMRDAAMMGLAERVGRMCLRPLGHLSKREGPYQGDPSPASRAFSTRNPLALQVIRAGDRGPHASWYSASLAMYGT